MKKFLKDNKIYFINTFIIIAIFILSLIINKITPFGNNILGKSDAIYQLKPMLYDFITKLRTGTLLNYSFNNALGNPFIFNYIYYLASPLNLIAILFKTPDGMYLSTILIKLLVGSICMTYYTKSKTNNNYIIFISTISYIFASWFLTYYFCTMWLDIFAIFPAYQKGLEDLLDNKKYTKYIIFLALLTICNIYLAFPVYIYTIIYFIIYELIYKKTSFKEKQNKFNIITLSTITSFLIVSIFVYFAFDAFIKSGLSFETGDITNYQIPFFDFIKSLLYGNTNLLLYKNGDTFPNIACNTFVFINILYYFINKNINKKDKLFTLISILIILGALFIKRFDFILNFFHDVRGLTYRYAFIINFLTIKLLISNLTNCKENDFKRMLFTIPVIIIILLLVIKKQEFNITILNTCFIISFSIVLFLFSNNTYHKLIICILVSLESLLALNINLPEIREKEDINLKLYQKENTKYRLNAMNNGYEENYNYNLYYNGKTTYAFSTINYNRTINLASNLGCDITTNSAMFIDDNNIIPTLLFNVKNDYYLEKIFTVNKSITMTDSGMDTSIKENIENIIYSMTGIKDIYDKTILKATIEDDNYLFSTDEEYYLIEIINEDGSTSTIPQRYKTFTQKINEGHDTATIYTINKDKLKDIYDYLSKNQIKYTYYNDNHLEGTITVPENQIIYTSIPYDDSWEIKIDNKIVKPLFILDSLIGIEVEPGTHTISMKYKNTYYIGPLILSIISLIGFIIFNIKQKKKN